MSSLQDASSAFLFKNNLLQPRGSSFAQHPYPYH